MYVALILCLHMRGTGMNNKALEDYTSKDLLLLLNENVDAIVMVDTTIKTLFNIPLFYKNALIIFDKTYKHFT